MLRPIEKGYSGHVRLERRTLTAGMYFIVNLPDVPGDLYAVLSGSKRDGYYAAKLGILRRDGRGQATLACSFDPRNIDGRALEEYIFVMVARSDGDRCGVVLSGNVNGSQAADFAKAEEAVCAILTPECDPAADIPGADDEAACLCRQEEVQAPVAREAWEDTGSPADSAPEDADSEAVAPVFAQADEGAGRSAADAAGLDASVTWPSAIEGIRDYFAGQPVQEMGFDDDFVYVKAPMPEGSGFPYVLIGIETDDGRVEAVRFALPGRFSESPPAGLDGYVFRGGPSGGWWVITVDPQTGNAVEFDD